MSTRITKRTIMLAFLSMVFLLSLAYMAGTLIDLANQLAAERNGKMLDYGVERVENKLTAVGDVLAAVKNDPQRDISLEKASGEMSRLQRDCPEIRDIWLASPDQRVVYATNPSLQGRVFEDAACFSQARLQKHTVVSDCPVSQGLNNQDLSLFVPLFEGEEFRGVIGATIEPGSFSALLQDIVQHEDKMVLTIFDRRGNVLASSSSEAARGLELGEFSADSTFMQGRVSQKTARSPVFKDQRFYLYSALLDGQLLLVLSQPVEEMYRPWLVMLRTGVPLLLISLILLLWLVYQIFKLEDMRRLEALEYQAEKAHAVAELAASIAHEIRNPITAIRGFMQLISQRHEDAKTQEYARIIVEEVDTVEENISEFLNLAKPHISKQGKCNLQDVLRSVYLLAKGRAVNNGVQVVFNMPESTMVMGDGMQMKQAFLNLCANAIQAMPKGGRLTISAVCTADTVTIKIADTGEGIAPQHVKRLGERFFTTKATGTGIGLAVTYRTIRRHRGKIQVISIPGAGTEFTVILPVWVEPGAHGEPGTN